MIDFVLQNLIELASLPGSIPKLRSFILDQAVRGNLTTNWRRDHPEVEPASVLLERIRQEKRELVRAGKIKKQKELPPVEAEEVPFAVPESSEWVRLRSSVIDLRIGPFGSLLHKRDYVAGGIPVINPQHYSAGLIKYSSDTCIRPEKANELSAYRMSSGDLITARRGELGRNAIVTEIQDGFLCGTGSMFVRPGFHVKAEFLSLYLNAPTVRDLLHGQSRGATMRNLSAQTLSILPFPLGSPEEQTEIVRRVDQLMALCDQLEAAQTRRDDTRRRALAAGATQLTDDTTDQPFADIWPRFTARLPELIQHPDDIKPVQDAILQLAVRGHLTADWRATHPDTEPASALIARIKEEKQAMVKAGKIKKQKELPPVEPEEVPFEVPEGWEWTRPIELGIPSPRNSIADKTTVGFVPMQLVPDRIFAANLHEERPWSTVKSGFTHIANGDVCIAKITPSFENGKGCVVSGLRSEFGAATTELHVLRPVSGTVEPWYLFLFFRSDLFRSIAIPRMTGTAGQKRVTRSVFEETAMPLPPLPEQTEIVRRVDELMALCNELASTQRDRAVHGEQLLATALGVPV